MARLDHRLTEVAVIVPVHHQTAVVHGVVIAETAIRLTGAAVGVTAAGHHQAVVGVIADLHQVAMVPQTEVGVGAAVTVVHSAAAATPVVEAVIDEAASVVVTEAHPNVVADDNRLGATGSQTLSKPVTLHPGGLARRPIRRQTIGFVSINLPLSAVTRIQGHVIPE